MIDCGPDVHRLPGVSEYGVVRGYFVYKLALVEEAERLAQGRAARGRRRPRGDWPSWSRGRYRYGTVHPARLVPQEPPVPWAHPPVQRARH